VVVPWDPPRARRGHDDTDGDELLEQRTRWVAETLRRAGVESRRLADRELAQLLRSSLDPSAHHQPIAPNDPLVDVALRIAPPGVREDAAAVRIGARFARSAVVVGYPEALDAGWLSCLEAFDGDVDVGLHIVPASGAMAMRFLERRIAELSTTVRISEERTGSADPYRRAALGAASELRDELARGSERLFDTTLAFTVWAESVAELEERTMRIETLLASRAVQSRRLTFEMRDGLLATLPLGQDRIGATRPLSTSAVGASFPFVGPDLPRRSGVLYGIETRTRTPVSIDRFALENHNAVVFATSGAGKSYLVKTELARAHLAGVRAVVIDPEGEYASLLGALGAVIVPVGPDVATGLDAFAPDEDTPAAFARRAASVTTLIGLLAGGFERSERVGVEAAVADSYAELRPRVPRLPDVHERLAAARDLARVADGVQRVLAGPSAWLFEPTVDGLPADDASVVYVLSELGEDVRAAAMFVVLERIWSNLARSDQPTLVVVDEAWWLMRHRETAAYLFRLVKTARKRRAGLTLITQDTTDVLAHPDGEALVTNASLQILMRQAPQALPRLAELFRLSEAEQSYLLGAQRGDALLLVQGKRVPLHVVATDEEVRLIERRVAQR
jgi:hypothetical protein